jgi:surface polysaccharide O-acyltransferase-like enzyme
MTIFSEMLRNRAQKEDDDSLVIEYLRFPLAVAVLLIHNFGTPVQPEILHQNVMSLSAVFDLIRIGISHVACHFANPAFFLISGYLFWNKDSEWSFAIYKNKIKKRVNSIFFPYCLWIILYITPDLVNELWRIFFYGKSFYSLLYYIYAIGDIRIFWDSCTWGTNYTNWLGKPLSSSGPILGPLWFLRDLMVAMVFSPVIHFTIKKWGKWTILVLWIFYLSMIWFPIHGFSIECYFWFSCGSFCAI